MKKVLLLLLGFILITSITTACGKKEEKDTNPTTQNNVENTINQTWDEVKDEYAQIEEKVNKEFNYEQELNKEALLSLVNTINDNYKLSQDKNTKDKNTVFKNMYEAAHKLEKYRVKNDNVHHEITEIGTNAKTYIKATYIDSSADMESSQESLEIGLNNALSYNDNQWNEFIEFIKNGS